MDHSTHPTRSGLNTPGVHGWLLLLCLMLTVIGPLITLGLMVYDAPQWAAYIGNSPAMQAQILLSRVLTAAAVAVGIYAGLRLWSIKPGAVALTKKALLLGLAVDIVNSVIEVAAGPQAPVNSVLINRSLLNMLPDLIFFTLGFAYLNKSARVQATYRQ